MSCSNFYYLPLKPVIKFLKFYILHINHYKYAEFLNLE